MYLAIDIGGTKTLAAVFSETGELIESVKFPTPAEYTAFLAELEKVVQSLETKEFISAAVGMPGIIDRAKNACLTAGGNLTWKDCLIGVDIEKFVGCNVFLENDANLAGLSEAILVKDTYPTAVYITISTGIGGVFVVNGVIDPNTINAEIGHMIYKRESGEYQSWESFASGKAIVAKYGKRASDIDDIDTWREITEDIALGMINVAVTLTPSVIIVGGGAGANLHKFEGPLNEWTTKLYPAAAGTMPPVIEAQRPEEAVIYGCYELAKQHRA